MHVAAAITTNLVSIHTWSDPRRVGPYNAAATIWKNGKLFLVADLESATDLRKGRKFRREDVGPIAELAMRAVAKQPLICCPPVVVVIPSESRLPRRSFMRRLGGIPLKLPSRCRGGIPRVRSG